MRPGSTFLTDPDVIAATVGTTSGLVLPPAENRGVVWVHNPSLTATIAVATVSSGVTPSATAPVAGQITLTPGETIIADNSRLTGGLNAAASAANSPLTIWIF